MKRESVNWTVRQLALEAFFNGNDLKKVLLPGDTVKYSPFEKDSNRSESCQRLREILENDFEVNLLSGFEDEQSPTVYGILDPK